MFVYKWKGPVGGHELCDACPGPGGSDNTLMKTKAGSLSVNFEAVTCLCNYTVIIWNMVYMVSTSN